MATMYVEEYKEMERDDKGNVIGPGVVIARQKVAVGVSSAASSAFNAKTRFILIETDTVAQYLIGTAPTADTNSAFLSVNNRKLVALPLSTTAAPFKIAAIDQQ